MKKITTLTLVLLFPILVFAQVENVRLSHNVYKFLKKMKLKRMIESVHDYDPSMSRQEVKDFLDELKEKQTKLNYVERETLNKYLAEFSDVDNKYIDHHFILGQNKDLGFNGSELLDDKWRYFYNYTEENFKYFVSSEWTFSRGNELKGAERATNFYQSDVYFRGTIAKHLGLNLTFNFLVLDGSDTFAPLPRPELMSNIKFINRDESFMSANDAYGYFRVYFEPLENMDVAFQIGKEPLNFGYGYGDKLVLSTNSPKMDFLKFDLNYGALRFTSYHGSTVGSYSKERLTNFTKYFAHHSLHLYLPGLFEAGLGEVIMYGNRGIEMGYIAPLAFWKYNEHGLQDRDNGCFYVEAQTDFMDNIEFEAVWFMDETPTPAHFTEWGNKYAYQFGLSYYEPFGLNNLTMMLEYTRIRPYVYTHRFEASSYTAFGQNLGHRAGPNADEIFVKGVYDFSDRLSLELEYQKVRSGENVYDEDGNLLINHGGDYMYSYEEFNGESKESPFLGGIRVDNHIIKAKVLYEMQREIHLFAKYSYLLEDHIDDNYLVDYSFIETGIMYGF